MRLIFSFMGEVLGNISNRGDDGDGDLGFSVVSVAVEESSPWSGVGSVSLSSFDGRLSTTYDTNFSRKNASAFV